MYFDIIEFSIISNLSVFLNKAIICFFVDKPIQTDNVIQYSRDMRSRAEQEKQTPKYSFILNIRKGCNRQICNPFKLTSLIVYCEIMVERSQIDDKSRLKGLAMY
jgi:hypothetical protein